jgi:hypothetical protein
MPTKTAKIIKDVFVLNHIKHFVVVKMTKSLQLTFVAHFDFNIVQMDIKAFFHTWGS